MFANNALHNRQAYSRALKIPRLVQPLKNSEELADVLHLKARTVVAYKDHALVVLPYLTDFNYRMFPLPGIFEGIRQQIHEYLFHQSRIAFRAEQVSDVPVHLPRRTLRRKLLDNLPQQQVQWRRLERELLPPDL